MVMCVLIVCACVGTVMGLFLNVIQSVYIKQAITAYEFHYIVIVIPFLLITYINTFLCDTLRSCLLCIPTIRRYSILYSYPQM